MPGGPGNARRFRLPKSVSEGGNQLRGRGIRAAAAVAAGAAVSLIAAAPGHTWNEEATEGCTPGYWKTHTEAWVGFTPDQALGSVFTFPNAADPLASATLL